MKLIQDGLRIAGDALHSASVYEGEIMTPKSSSVFDMPSRLEHQLQQRRPPGAPRIMQRRQCVISTVTKASPSIMQMHQCVSSDVSKAAATFGSETGYKISSVSEASPTFSFGTAGLASSAVSEAVRTFSSGTAGFKSFHMKAVAQSNALSSAATSSGFLGSASGFSVNTAARSSGLIGSPPSSGFLGSASGFGVNTAARSSGLMDSPPGFSFALPPQPPLAAAQASISPSYEEARWNQRWQPGQRSCRVTAQEQVYELLCRKEEVRMPKTLLRRSAFAMPHMALQQQASMPSKRARTRPSFLTLSALQCEEGYWLLNEELGSLLNINVNYLIDEFLSKNGIQSLGRKGKEEVLKLIATLLVLQVICTFKLVNVTFKSLMKLDESCCTSPYYQTIEKSTKWARKTDDQYPGICSRLGLGKDWESATRKLLSIDPLDPSSSLLPAVV